MLPALLYSHETWAQSANLERQIDATGKMCLYRIMQHHWNNFFCQTGNYCETDLTYITA